MDGCNILNKLHGKVLSRITSTYQEPKGAAWTVIACVLVSCVTWSTTAQVNTGSDGHDGVFNPSTNVVIDMADHPDGIYQYTSVNIPTNATVTFIPNANNTPVVWLVQGNCVINGTVDVGGGPGSLFVPGQGGPGGGAGGYGGHNDDLPTPRRGAGLGGGDPASAVAHVGGNGSYATLGNNSPPGNPAYAAFGAAGLTYGNKFLLPLRGGSGGGGGWPNPNPWCGGQSSAGGGGGGGGGILIASDHMIRLDGSVLATGGTGGGCPTGGGGSGGGIRLLAQQIFGLGTLSVIGGWTGGGAGFVRLDVSDDQFLGTLHGSASRGFNPVLTLPANQNIKLAIQSIGGSAVPVPPSGVLNTPDATIPAQLEGPLSVVVSCVNLPLNSSITVVAKPVNAPMVLATAVNSSGTLASSTATAQISIPRGGGLIYATAAITR